MGPSGGETVEEILECRQDAFSGQRRQTGGSTPLTGAFVGLFGFVFENRQLVKPVRHVAVEVRRRMDEVEQNRVSAFRAVGEALALQDHYIMRNTMPQIATTVSSGCGSNRTGIAQPTQQLRPASNLLSLCKWCSPRSSLVLRRKFCFQLLGNCVVSLEITRIRQSFFQ